ncbi:MAG: DNA polymerase IV [Armatimonadota bacterium]|nr:DNA polymerase IV [Armatimonadota bacterium]MDR7451157.1 DNA polymerase IV [Armatimonadota bacterium]MDR7467238.1 DNA polymerase IV [Armatimonadota bacterium]MDR7494834.1 DNA polymerase IV [Armatimonadota bacterium]MDR7500273.1 DNA polymerase IV [Armatimonadota bacterium]
MTGRTILHVDVDAFFAAVEQLRRPELRGRPVVVGGDGNPHRRGVVSTASYEARAYGIHSAMPLRTAYRLCPEAVFLPVDFRTYGEYSRRIMAILREYTPLVEQVSVDEAFLDVSARPEDPLDLAETIRRRIREETGLTISVGIGPNKLLAKIASGLRKPDAVTRIPADRAAETLRDLPVRVLWGVGPKTAARLQEAFGVRTVGELCAVPLERLQALLGPHHGAYLYHVCRGEDDSPIVTEWEPKSMSRETTYQVDTRKREVIVRTIAALAEEVADDLRRDGYRGRTVTVKIRYHDFKTHTRARTLEEEIGNARQIREAALTLLDRFTLDRPVRLVGVRVSGLVRREAHRREAHEDGGGAGDAGGAASDGERVDGEEPGSADW